VYRPCLHVAHQNKRVNGTNFVINFYKTHVKTLKSKYSIEACLHSLIFGRDCHPLWYDMMKFYFILARWPICSAQTLVQNLIPQIQEVKFNQTITNYVCLKGQHTFCFKPQKVYEGKCNNPSKITSIFTF